MRAGTANWTLLRLVLLWAAALVASGCEKEEVTVEPKEPWLLVRGDQNEWKVVYIQEELATVDYVRHVGQSICAGIKHCSASFYIDFGIAQEAAKLDKLPPEISDKKYASFWTGDLSEKVTLECPEETIVMVGDIRLCDPVIGYWVKERKTQ